jgi:hypothetical protein
MPALLHVTAAQIKASCELGIAWLAAQQDPLTGSWGSNTSFPVAYTGFALLKLEDRAFELGFDSPFDSAYQYSENVTNGLNFLLSRANRVDTPPYNLNDPDANIGGANTMGGICFSSSPTDCLRYETGIAMMAIAASRDPQRPIIGGDLNGWTYKQVLGDAVDYLAYSQVDSGAYRGGWRYVANSDADNSVSGYAVIGLQYAENPLYGFDCIIPDFVRTQLDQYWIPHIQNPSDNGSCYMGCGGGNLSNSLRTGNLLCEMKFADPTCTPSTPRVHDAIQYISDHWYENTLDPGWGFNQLVAHYQATYCLMKGLQSMGVPLNGVPGVADWYQDLADVIVRQQIQISGNLYGAWPESLRGDHVLSTVWALLTLERVAPPSGCACEPKGVEVQWNGSLPGNQFVDCNSTVTISQVIAGSPITMAPVFACTGNCLHMPARYNNLDWYITKDTNTTISWADGEDIFPSFTLHVQSDAGAYTATFDEHCDNQTTCECVIHINIRSIGGLPK